LPKVASNAVKRIGMDYAWRLREIEHAGTLSAPRKPLQEPREYCSANTVPIALFQHSRRPSSPKNDEKHLHSLCADAPVFKMLRLANGEFYDVRTTVKNFVDCEEAVLEAYHHKLSEAVAQRHGQCRFDRHILVPPGREFTVPLTYRSCQKPLLQLLRRKIQS
jgi:hypothetical protein